MRAVRGNERHQNIWFGNSFDECKDHVLFSQLKLRLQMVFFVTPKNVFCLRINQSIA